jgi:predicted GTPase
MVGSRAVKKIKRGGARRAKRRMQKTRKTIDLGEALEKPAYKPVEVTKTNYSIVEGFCRVCGAKIYGDKSLIHHLLEHDSDLTVSNYLSMSEDEKFKAISALASKYLTAREPKWYTKTFNPLSKIHGV